MEKGDFGITGFGKRNFGERRFWNTGDFERRRFGKMEFWENGIFRECNFLEKGIWENGILGERDSGKWDFGKIGFRVKRILDKEIREQRIWRKEDFG